MSFQNLTDSYVDVAVDQYGYSTFAIDRFGIGKSSVADPLSIVQAPAALSAIHELTTMLRQGKVTNIPHAFSKIIHVGHSFGSILGVNLAAMYPTDSDALILTGFAPNSSFVGTTLANWNFKLARLSQPFRFGNANPARATKAAIENFGGSLEAMGVPLADVKPMLQTTELGNLMAGIEPSDTPHMQDLPCGYLTWTDAGCNQFSFLYPGFFDQDTLQWSEANKFPVTVGEVLTLGGGAQGAPEFRGPVMVFTGGK